ncbi:MAG TPA: hypothetical protein VGK27_08800 [Candidatus Deferrimicrobiaceae bacterium]|jgi:hypothetical protein
MATIGKLHKPQLCHLKNQGMEGLLKSLSSKPTVRCEICGLYADEGENVCSPRQLPELGWLGDGADNVGSH